MLTLQLITNIEEAKEKYSILGVNDEPRGVQFLFLEDEKEVGFARILLDNTDAIIDKIFYLDSVEVEDKEFFLRSVLYKFQGSAVLLKIKGDQKDFYKFGFVYEDGYTSIWSQNIQLTGGCPSHK